ncbi:MAG TPA: helix-turn-helix transcriptional regulator [Candidatus Elarobacter sp.]|jgi:DNA-binding CsgD family transcriptional regulator
MADPRSGAARKTASAPSEIAYVALDHYRAGDLRLAARIALAGIAGGDTSPELVDITAQTAIRTGERELLERSVAARRPARGEPKTWLRAAFDARHGDRQRAATELRALLAAAASPLREELAYHLAVALWGARDLDGAEAVVARHVDAAAGFARASLQQMTGWIEIERERYALAGRHFADALDSLDAWGQRDEWARARTMHALSGIAVETLDVRALQHFAAVPDRAGAEASESLFFTLQNIAWLKMLDGDEPGALADLERARAIAPSARLIAVAEVNRASYFRICGDAGAARIYLQLAGDALRGRRWADASADERMALLEYALEAYQLEPATAGPTLARYLSGARKRRNGPGSERDRRAQATELTARGALEASRKRAREAGHVLREALDLWTSMGFRYREAVTALLLDDVAPGEGARDAARRATASAPKSWLRRDVERRSVRRSSGYQALSPAERRVMLAICEGKTSKQIAADFGRSFHTIRNQTLKVYSTMGVRTRSALVAECARLGLLGPLP